MTSQSHMRDEIDEIPEAVRRLIAHSRDEVEETAAALRALDPRLVVTIARGSSDNAAVFLKYAIERTVHLPVASLGPSLASIYGATPMLERAAALAISQSGESPDIIAMTRLAAEGGGMTIAFSNTVPSPLADECHHRIDIAAGVELSVAATKSFVNSVVAGLLVLARWTTDDALLDALEALPDRLVEANSLDWSSFAKQLDDARSLFVLGRGPGMAIASEAALKFKETCGLHAEAYSTAEVLHGPVELVGREFPILVLAARDAAEDSVVGVADILAEGGVPVSVTSSRARAAAPLPFVATGHPLTDALALIVPLYGFVERWSRDIGRNPDSPTHLKKVTQTI